VDEGLDAEVGPAVDHGEDGEVELVLPRWPTSFVVVVAVMVVGVVGTDGDRASINHSRIADRNPLLPAPSTVMVGTAEDHIPRPVCFLLQVLFIEAIWAPSGRYFSKTAVLSALTEVCPTILVADAGLKGLIFT
jgi:hypothetical protein